MQCHVAIKYWLFLEENVISLHMFYINKNSKYKFLEKCL